MLAYTIPEHLRDFSQSQFSQLCNTQVFLVPRCYFQIRNCRTQQGNQRPFLPMCVRHTFTKALWCRASFIFVNLRAHIDHGFMLQTLKRESSGQLAGFTHVQAASPLSRHPTPLGGASHASIKSMSMEINPPTLDLRALSLNRAPGASKAPSRLLLYRTTTSRPPSPSPPLPAPPVKSEDDEMEDLYGPSLGLPSSHTSRHEPRRRRSLSPHLPAEPEPRVLPVLAAKDPHVLAVLEGQERREAARQRRGMHKAQAVRGAGKRRAGFVLVEGLTARRTELNFQALFERKRNLLASFLEATRDC